MQRAAEGLQTFETVDGLGPYPVRILTQPVREAGRVTSLIQVGMSLESVAVTRRRFLLVMATVLPWHCCSPVVADGYWPGGHCGRWIA